MEPLPHAYQSPPEGHDGPNAGSLMLTTLVSSALAALVGEADVREQSQSKQSLLHRERRLKIARRQGEDIERGTLVIARTQNIDQSGLARDQEEESRDGEAMSRIDAARSFVPGCSMPRITG